MTIEFWRMGPTPVPCSDAGIWARRFEEMGWHGLCISETPLLPDTYATLALAAATTEKLMLGSAVVVPVRHPLWAANAMVTIQAISKGRASFTLGRGDGAMHSIGERAMSINRFSSYLDRLQAYLRGESVDLGGVSSTMTGMAAIDQSFENLPKVPVSVAATGPRVIDLGARSADGVTLCFGTNLAELKTAIARAQSARANVGLDPHNLEVSCVIPVGVTSSGDFSAVRDSIRGIVMILSRFRADLSPNDSRESSDEGSIRPKVGSPFPEAGYNPIDDPRQAVEDASVDQFAV